MNVKNIGISFVILFGFWLLLNGTFTTPIIVTGLIVSLIIPMFFCARCDVFADMRLTPKAFLYTFIYLFVFAFELVKANLDVTRRVISPKLPINPGIVKVKTKLKSKMARMILANSITLTPGTFTLAIEKKYLYIHWIDVQDKDVEAATKDIVQKFEKYLEVIYG